MSFQSHQIDSDEERPVEQYQTTVNGIEQSLTTKLHERHHKSYISGGTTVAKQTPQMRHLKSSFTHPYSHYIKIPMLSVKDDPLLFQGELLKLKPGFKMEFQSRWIQVTGRALRYYKNRWTKNSALLKPLCAIPVEAISRI